jgi:hypothetical protein
MRKPILTTIALSLLLIASGCATNSSQRSTTTQQTVQQKQACSAGAPRPWCMQLAQTRPFGSWDSNGPTNPEMQNDTAPYPQNQALALAHRGALPFMMGGMR